MMPLRSIPGRMAGRLKRPQVVNMYSDDSDNAAVIDTDTDDAVIDDDSSPGKPYIFADPERESSSLKGFQALRLSGELIDVTLLVEETEFPCHRAFLAAASDYFRCLFTTSLEEQGRSTVTVSLVTASSMKLVLDYIYTGKVELTTDCVQSLLSAANLFQLKGLRDGCADFMEQKIEIDNCIGIHFFAQVCH